MCHQPISSLYPFIELITTALLYALMIQTSVSFWPAYGLFFSALIITIRTDIETMLISRFVSLFLIPLGIILSWFNFLPLSPLESILGASSAYVFLFVIAQTYYWLTNNVGMGQGDIELLAFIGSFIGIIGWWMSLLIGSLLGSLVGLWYFMYNGSFRTTKIPFGPFLACGALCYVLFQQYLLSFIGIF